MTRCPPRDDGPHLAPRWANQQSISGLCCVFSWIVPARSGPSNETTDVCSFVEFLVRRYCNLDLPIVSIIIIIIIIIMRVNQDKHYMIKTFLSSNQIGSSIQHSDRLLRPQLWMRQRMWNTMMMMMMMVMMMMMMMMVMMMMMMRKIEQTKEERSQEFETRTRWELWRNKINQTYRCEGGFTGCFDGPDPPRCILTIVSLEEEFRSGGSCNLENVFLLLPRSQINSTWHRLIGSTARPRKENSDYNNIAHVRTD